MLKFAHSQNKKGHTFTSFSALVLGHVLKSAYAQKSKRLYPALFPRSIYLHLRTPKFSLAQTASPTACRLIRGHILKHSYAQNDAIETSSESFYGKIVTGTCNQICVCLELSLPKTKTTQKYQSVVYPGCVCLAQKARTATLFMALVSAAYVQSRVPRIVSAENAPTALSPLSHVLKEHT